MLGNLRQLYQYRALIGALVTRHLSIRYRGSALGFLWSLLNPLCLMLVYTLVFKYYIRFSEVENYTIFLFCGLLPWLWTTGALLEGTSAISSSGHLITKSMFPAHVLPTVAVLTNLVNFLLSLPLLFLFMWGSGMELHWTLLGLPVLIFAQSVFLWGGALALSSLNVYLRDVQHLIGNLLTLLFFLCPILYPLDIVPEKFKFTFDFNPFALMTVFYQDLVLTGQMPLLPQVVFVLVSTLLVAILGNVIYNRYREGFAELL